MIAILFHGVQDGLGLEAGCLHRSPCDMALLRMLCQTEDGSSSIIYPVRGKKTTKGRHKYAAAVIVYRGCQIIDMMGSFEKVQVVLQKLYSASGNSNTAFQSIDWFSAAAKVVPNCAQQPMFGDYRLFANVVQQETASPVSVLGLTWGEYKLSHKRS